MRADFRDVSLRRGMSLTRSGEPFNQLHFPVSGVVSAVADLDAGAVEMATIGSEGMVEVGAILGSHRALHHHVVQVSGRALALPFRRFLQLRECEPFRAALSAYAQAFLTEVMQSVACNAVHPVGQRTARWLLACHDRIRSDRFGLTQEFLAEMLGVSRATVSVVARTLQRSRLISYTRGEITILDRGGLEAVACECYARTRRAYVERSLGTAQN